jgi:hypothetical protein
LVVKSSLVHLSSLWAMNALRGASDQCRPNIVRRTSRPGSSSGTCMGT